ncbi:MAG: sugar ABC transporter permease [Prevotella sp.]|nr:sugar ABC transporter permease [Alistipes senegalensis]MCM1357939.1 sugar ABC transporter permease [Prevotella sp.]MCM1473948.1 sugar ABC transporter permease [Muribaculaceae bacterium]
MFKKIRKEFKKNSDCYLMLMPFMVLFLIFTVIPVVMSVPVSFTDFNMIQSPEFIGLSNYTALFLSDKIFMKSIRITLIFAFFTGLISYIMCLMVAWLIDSMPRKTGDFFTVIFYIPSMANVYSVWRVIFSGDMNGYINSLLISIGFITSPIQWLTDGRYVLFTAIIVQMWLSLGAGFLAIRAGLRGIDRSMYEAGAVEGIRNKFQELIYITIPSMKPHLMFAGVMQIVSSFTAGTVIQNIAGFPTTDYNAHTVMTHAYDYGWVRYEMGYASAICMILFLVMYFVNRLLEKILGKNTD